MPPAVVDMPITTEMARFIDDRTGRPDLPPGDSESSGLLCHLRNDIEKSSGRCYTATIQERKPHKQNAQSGSQPRPSTLP